MKYILILALLVLAELVYFRVAERFGIIDRPNLRSSHALVTLRGGGIIFPVAVWFWAAFFGVEYPWFLAGLTLISLVSFADDIRSVPIRARLAAQFTAMFLLFAQLGILRPQLWWTVLIAWVVTVGIVNAYNFMDGINGITGGYSIAVLLPLMAADRRFAFAEESLLLVVGLSLLVFCFFNFRIRARCFAGDVGAVGMAFILVFLLGRLILKTGDFTYILFLALYGVDAILTLVHRILLHEDLGEAHRKHAYQLMANELHIPHLAVSLVYMALQLAVSAGLLYLPLNHWLYAAAVLAVLCAVYIGFMKKYYPLHEEYLKRSSK